MKILTYAGLTTTMACFCLAPLAQAQSKVGVKGYTQPVTVEIDRTAPEPFAHGDLRSARDDANSNVFIGCHVDTHITDGGAEYGHGYCQANDGKDYVICFTDSIVLMEGMRAINDTSYINFTWGKDGDGNYNCKSVSASTMSFYLK